MSVPALRHRKIPSRLRKIVFDRDGYTCQMCGVSPSDADPFVPARRARLTVGFYVLPEAGGGYAENNLRVLCLSCKEGFRKVSRRGFPALDRPSLLKLLIQLRRATGADQLEVLKWLVQKFPKQAQDLSK